MKEHPNSVASAQARQMTRMAGQDAVFLYRETPTALMHTLKLHIMEVADNANSFDQVYQKLLRHLSINPVLRKRILPVPFGIHHPVLVDDPDFNVGAHIFRVAVPAPGTMREVDAIVAQIGSTPLDRSRPLWEIWVLEGLQSGDFALVHKVHHAMADGMAYVSLLTNSWAQLPDEKPPPPAAPLPGGARLLGDALLDHIKHDVWNLWPIAKSFTLNMKTLWDRNRAAKQPRVNPFTARFPRLRFNYALGVKRDFASCQLPLREIRALKQTLDVTINDVVLAIVAGALRHYLENHGELPDAPLALSIPVGADEPGSQRQMGNRVTALFTQLHTQLEDPLARLQAIKADTELGKEDLRVLGKHQWGDLMEYVPPALTTWSCQRSFRLKPSDRPDYKPTCNMVISNVPGPAEALHNDTGTLKALYSVGVLGEGMGLNITVWSYRDQLNVAALACHKAVPDLRRLTDAIPGALEELQLATTAAMGESA